MRKVIILKGLPASGKTTWAKELMKQWPEKYKRINKDDLRSMFDGGVWSKRNEQFVLHVRDYLIVQALMDGFDVIVDDTNLHPKHEEQIKKIVKAIMEDFIIEIKEFDTPLQECIDRDRVRTNRVGEKVIRDMHARFLYKQPDPYPFEKSLSTAVICDLDGTLALMKDRGPFEWDKVGNDELNKVVDEILLHFLELGDTIIILSGRDSVCRDKTEKWLNDNHIAYDYLFMRPEGDNRKDSIVKRELFDNHIRGKYNVKFVLDDRNQVVEMWRSLGLKCFQVADGNF